MLDAIFTATFEEVAAVGFGGLAMENVAARAGVNKTTIYRRWPTRSALVADAVEALWTKAVPPAPNTGSLRGDLEEMVLEILRGGPQPLGRALLRLYLFDAVTPELAALRERIFRNDEGRDARIVVDRAMGRGELPPRTSYLMIKMLRGAAILHMLVPRDQPDEEAAREMVDTLLTGVLPREAAATPSGPPVGAAKRPARPAPRRR